MARIESELLFLLQDEEVDAATQQAILTSGYYTFRRFALLGDARADVRGLFAMSSILRTLFSARWR